LHFNLRQLSLNIHMLCR